jgi:transcriptional regulator with XRE-family HTH domain
VKRDENPVRRLRRELGMNRADFGRAIGKSHQTVGNYESGIRVPPDVVERMKQLAAEHALADIALELSSDDWQVRHVIEPGETLISSARPIPGPGNYNPANQAWHDMLETILESGDKKAIEAVQPNLVLFHAWVAERSPVLPAKKTTQHPASKAKKTG